MKNEGFAEKLKERQSVSYEHIKFVEKVAQRQIDGGREFLGENPWTSRAWGTPAGKRLLQKLGRIKTHMCRHGLRKPGANLMLRKPTCLESFMSGSQSIREGRGDGRAQVKKSMRSLTFGGSCKHIASGGCKNITGKTVRLRY